MYVIKFVMAGIGGIMIGSSVSSLAMDCNGISDARMYIAFSGFAISMFTMIDIKQGQQ